jgi:hypothetical protein
MNNEKNSNSLQDLLEACKDDKKECFSLGLSETDASLMARSIPSSAFILKKDVNCISTIGFLDNKRIEFSSNEDAKFPNQMIIGVDCRKEGKNKVYYQANGNDVVKISHKTEMTKDDIFLIFWENKELSCLTFCGYDNLRQEVIIEVISATDPGIKKFLRGISREYLYLLAPDTLNQI